LIFREGGKPSGIFCMNTGKVKITKMGDEGKEQIVRLARPGDILGYRSLISGEAYSGSAAALEDASICFIPRSTIIALIESSHNFSFELLKLLSHDLKEAEEKMTNLAQKPVRERLAEALLFIKETYGFTEDQQTINVNLTREDMANVVGTATETTIRLLSDFKSEGIIELNGRKIKLLDVARLLRIANLHD
jgi:CRP/FNR family transcriptional regulator